jgi:hypothetical protein
MVVLSPDLSVVGGTLQKIVDLVAEDMPALLKQLDGRTIPFPSGSTVLHSAGHARIPDEASPRTPEDAQRSQHRLPAHGNRHYWNDGRIVNLGTILPGIVDAISPILECYTF